MRETRSNAKRPPPDPLPTKQQPKRAARSTVAREVEEDVRPATTAGTPDLEDPDLDNNLLKLAGCLPNVLQLAQTDFLTAHSATFLIPGDILFHPKHGFGIFGRTSSRTRPSLTIQSFQLGEDVATQIETLLLSPAVYDIDNVCDLQFTNLNVTTFSCSRRSSVSHLTVGLKTVPAYPDGMEEMLAEAAAAAEAERNNMSASQDEEDAEDEEDAALLNISEEEEEEEGVEDEAVGVQQGGAAAEPAEAYTNRRREQKRLSAKRRRVMQVEAATRLAQGGAEVLPPRELVSLRAVPTSDLIQEGLVVGSRDSALLLTAEVEERDGKLASYAKSFHKGLGKFCGKGHLQLLAGCGVDSECKHCVEWRPAQVKDSEGAWRCVSFQAHTCTALNQVKARTASTAYTPAQLAPIASRKLVENPKYDATGLKSDLRRYLCLDPTRSFVQSVMTIARAKLNGDPSGELAKLPVLAQLLREQGHRCEVHTLGAKEMEAVLVDIEHKEFLQEQKAKPVGQRDRWDKKKAHKYPVEEGKQYCLGWSFAPCTTIHTLDKCIPMSFGDGAHMRNNSAGILMSTVTRDANHHVVPMNYACLLMNECETSHSMQLIFSKEAYGDVYDHPDRREVSDKDKGLAAAWDTVMCNGSLLFTCARHRAEGVSTTIRPGGSEARALFQQAVKAPTIPKLEGIKAQYSTRAAEYLGKASDQSQYMAVCGKLHGQSVNSCVECMNAANEKVRADFKEGVFMTKALLTTVGLCEKRFTENKAKAQSATGQLPPAVILDVAESMEKALTITSGISFTSTDKVVARVASTVTPGVRYISTLRAGESAQCDCGVTALSGLPCHHNLAHARVTGRKWEDYVDPLKTTAQWKMQYPAHMVFPPVPNLLDCEAHPAYDPDLLLPPVAAKRKGRPKMQKRKLGVLERIGSKKASKCSKCGKAGHRSDKCNRI
ncbi:hypothetical protein CYMTET_9425 [Cymbomonas tetramitiformis]|uniref:SWIM-type domain-containing protein n=1 Tax=Cymbomonas tetramitiformis TaxID=36881 RepID=A0AAE0LF12_9CHLO|nr:hypothetical protein CYMTET_9425 [Cymbomonas tetramitiformis]